MKRGVTFLILVLSNLLVGACLFVAGVYAGGAWGGNLGIAEKRSSATLTPAPTSTPFAAFTVEPDDSAQAVAVCPPGSVNANVDADVPADLQDEFKPFWEAWSLLHQYYVDQPLDDQKLAYGAISGMLKAAGDRHTGYMDPAQFTLLTADSSGELEGIGAEVDTSGDFLSIVSPFPGSPAEAAGLLPGDVIIEVDGVDMEGVPPYEVITKVRGKAGTQVVLTIVREGEEEPLEFTITRYKITIPSVEGKTLESGLAYVKINQFGDKTAKELKETLTTLLAENPKGLVLDLRGNPGGYLNAAITVISQFVDQSPVMLERFGDGTEKKYNAEAGGLAVDIPMVVLINEGSASASEIVAGTIQDYSRGQIVGVTSYGKGTVQSWIPLDNNQGGVRITIARWLTPTGRTIDRVGIEPDVEVKLTKSDREAGLDPQLAEAERILLKGQ